MQIDPQAVFDDLQAIRKNSPLVHNITNYVVMEQTANALLAIGASPVMAHAIEEVEEMTKIANSLVLNIGTLSNNWIQAMMLSLKVANSKEIPVIFDPVGSGATSYRTKTAKEILEHGSLSVIRGNVSEILSLTENQCTTKGVDSVLHASLYREQAKTLALKYKCTVWMSGQADVISDGNCSFLVHNGDRLMNLVTGMGCTATAITGAFLSVNKNPFLGAVHAAALMGICGEIAARKSKGPGAFTFTFIDTLYKISLNEIEALIRVEAL